MVLLGFAVTVALVVVLNPVAGDQVKLTASFALAVSIVDDPTPTQMLGLDAVIVIDGGGRIVTVSWSVFSHPCASAPDTV